MKKEEDGYGFQVEDQEAEILEALIKSPVFPVLKKVLERYKKVCYSVLLNSKEPSKIFETQGRIIGANIIENLPVILVAQRQERLKKKKQQDSEAAIPRSTIRR